ncbi:acyltransferase [Agrobacterium salinitolerans]|uniref:acyltransferase family protein n=1 Tax=Agrobacterium salinitolerans TaxID=1183413 RepID=UPI0022B81D9B|nr:acyltransferase [Agrobacterium salinitolerans]MCZ7893306.1 acyltransferase [Agrobacterium salinitolerans]
MHTSSLSYQPRLDVMRFIAAALVIMFHVYVWGPSVPSKNSMKISHLIFSHGHAGVSLFIVMSGYLMAQIFIRYPAATYGEFIFNRAVRIVPLALLVVLGAAAMQEMQGEQWRTFLNLIFLQFNVDRANQISPLWTVATEIQFYLLMPLLAAMIRKNGLLQLLKLVAAIAIFRLMIVFYVMGWKSDSYNVVYNTLIGRFDQFAIGIALAYVPGNLRKTLGNPLNVLAAVALWLSLMALSQLNDWGAKGFGAALVQSFYLTAEGAIAGYFMFSFLNMRCRIPFEKAIAVLGASSYSMYLLHEIIVRTYMAHFPNYLIGIRADSVLILLPLVSVISLVSYFWFEKSFLIFRRRYSDAPNAAYTEVSNARAAAE